MAEFTQEKVSVRDLQEGMFVARLDRPWVGTPFPIQGFHVRNQNDVHLLGAYCRYVYVDVVRSKVAVESSRPAPRPGGNHGRHALVPGRKHYPSPSRDVDTELPVARRLHDDVTQALAQITAKVAAGKPASIAPAARVARRMIDSVMRNPDAAMWVARMRDQDSHNYARCVRSSVWAIAFGRHLGIEQPRLEHLALGVLLSEVGYTHLPTAVLPGQALGASETDLMKTHVPKGLEILRALKVHEEIAAVLATHHERHDGSGYPGGLRGSRIPLCGQIAGLVDVYDTLTSPREGTALTPAMAMAELHRMRDGAFHGELVEEFIQAIGIYPAGTLVELSSGEVGVIIQQHLERRLRPRILLILDGTKIPLKKRREIDLSSTTMDAAGQPIDIARSLPAGAYGINLVPPGNGQGMLRRLIDRGRGWLHR